MIAKVVAVAILAGLFIALGTVIARRNRRDRALRERLTRSGTTVMGTIRSLDKVSAGKYGTYKLRAHIDYMIDGHAHTHIAAWWPDAAGHLTVGGQLELLVDPENPAIACVADG